MPSYSLNKNYFNKIDNCNKAYWLGFLWADGYVTKRERLNPKTKTIRTEYDLKLSIAPFDKNHLVKFKKDLQSNHPIKEYKTIGFDLNNPRIECRIFITNKVLVSTLYNEYGIVPFRSDPKPLINAIPISLHKYFILGVFDGDGSFTKYQTKEGYNKFNVSFGGSEQLLIFIENHLIQNNLVVPYKRKIYRRHKNKDGNWRTLTFSGNSQCSKILNYLYDSPIYLDRKFEKYKNI